MSSKLVCCIILSYYNYFPYELDGLRFDSWQGKEIFLYSKMSRQAMRSIPFNGYWGVLSPGVRWLGLGVDLSPASSAKIKNEWRTTPPVSLHGMHTDNIYLYYYDTVLY
jgi:hypothetical protein